MAHELTTRKDGKVEFAFSNTDGNSGRQKIWHGLGQELTDGASIETWKREAGMEWEALESPVLFQVGTETKMMDDKKVLFRSDTSDSLAVVGSDYKIVQPAQVIEFFDDLTRLHGFKLSAAGTIFGGRRFWATADIGKDFETVSGDKITGQLLLATSLDGTMATTAKFCSTRTVCSNTLTVAMGENTKNMIKTSHRSTWDASQVKIDLGIVDSGWSKFSENMKKLTSVKLTDMEVEAYLTEKFYDKNKTADDQTWGVIKKVNALKSLYKGGMGAEFAPGTAYNLLNAVTEYADHYGNRKQDQARKFMENSFGIGDDLKTAVYKDMVALAA